MGCHSSFVDRRKKDAVRRHLKAPERNSTWAALQAELADRSGSCVGLSSAFGCFDRRGKTRSFLHIPLNYVTVKATFRRSKLTTWIPPIKVNKNKAIEHDIFWIDRAACVFIA